MRPSFHDRIRVRRRLISGLLGITLGALIALWAAPTSRWILRLHAALLCPPLARDTQGWISQDEGYPAARVAALRRAAAARPDDEAVQLALIEQAVPRENGRAGIPMTPLNALVARFPDRPDVLAGALRLATASAVKLDRPEIAAFHGVRYRPTVSSRPEDLASFDAIAVRGEALDPQNAYFPMMRASGLFAAHRDREALAAWARAARKPVWNSYTDKAAKGAMRLSDAVYGNGNFLARAQAGLDILFTDYTFLRSGAIVAVEKAIAAEKAGRPEEGYAIRQNLMRAGKLMRIQSTTFIGNIVGQSIVGIGSSHPYGEKVPVIQASNGRDVSQQREALSHAQFEDYLRRTGHGVDLPWVRAQWAASGEMRAVVAPVLERNDLVKAANRLLALLSIGVVLLADALGILAVALVAAIAGRLPADRPSARAVKAALALLTAGLLAGEVAVIGAASDFAASFFNDIHAGTNIVPFLFVLPLLLVIGLAVASHGEESLLDGMARRFRSVAVPVALGLLLLYGASVVVTARESVARSRSLVQLVQHEGRYYAQVSGKAWPQ